MHFQMSADLCPLINTSFVCFYTVGFFFKYGILSFILLFLKKDILLF